MKKEKKKPEPRAKKIKADLSALPPAIKDGKVLVKLKGKVLFERTITGKKELHEGELVSYDEKVVTLWDETRGQMFSFGVNDPVVVHARYLTELVEEQKE